MPPNILRTKSGRMCHLDAVRDQPLELPGDRRERFGAAAWVTILCAVAFAFAAMFLK